MRKIAALLLILSLLLMGFALGEQLPVQKNGTLAAYIDGSGHLYIAGNSQPVNKTTADQLISIDAYRVLFTSDLSDGSSDLYMIDLDTFRETRLASAIHAAAMADEQTLYYVPAAQRTQLWRLDLQDMTPRLFYTANAPIDQLMNTAEGLVFDRVDGMGAMVYVAASNSFETYARKLPERTLLSDTYELILRDGDLIMRDNVSLSEEHIDTGVQAFDILNGTIYYLANTGSAVRLKSCDPAAMSWQVILTLDTDMDRQLTATGGSLYMIDNARQIYTVNLQKKSLEPFMKVKDPSSYNLPAGYTASELVILGMEGQLNVYAALTETAAQPDFSFIEFTSTSDSLLQKYQLLETWQVDGEEASWTYLKPAAQYSPLSRGSRGEAVRAIQQPLYDLGYYDYYIDGIFGPRTQYAVELLQMDTGRPVTGVADSELQRLLLEGKAPEYDAYRALTRGMRGMRVQIMQEYLRDLGYLADSADGIFGGNTLRAVQRFQEENGLAVSEAATRETLKLLYSEDAQRCASYIDLYRGNTGYRVRALNNRLEELYYLEDNPGSTYTAATADAVRLFQRTAGLKVDGNATESVQRKLFSRNAPEAPGYITLRKGDENDRVRALQRRLRQLGYFTGTVTGYYGDSTVRAVKLFQRQVDLKVTGVATVRTQQLLFRSDAPDYVEETIIGTPVITIDPYDYRDGGVYCVSDDTDYVTFEWYASGDVDAYNVRIEEGDGSVIFDEDTYMTRTGVSVNTLSCDDVYTLTVTAYPADGDGDHVTSASLRFAVIESIVVPPVPEVGVVSAPEIALSAITRVQDGIQYVAEGEIGLTWHAEGELDHYYVELLNGSGDTLLSMETTDEAATINSASLTMGDTYTLFVYAIPVNGVLEEDSAVNAEIFALEDASIPAPEPEEEEIYTEPAQEPEEESEETPEPVEEPEEEPEEEPVPDTIPLTQPDEAIDAPTLAFDPVIEVRDDVSYVSGDVVTMRWATEGEASGYHVVVTTSGGNAVADATTDKNGLSVKSDNLIPGEVYTLTVTAIPAGMTEVEGATAQAMFALYQPEVAEEVGEEAPEDVYITGDTEEYAQEQNEGEEADENTEDEAPAPGGIVVYAQPSVSQSAPYVEENDHEQPVIRQSGGEAAPYVEEDDSEQPVIRQSGGEAAPYVEENDDEQPVKAQPAIQQGGGEAAPYIEEDDDEQPSVQVEEDYDDSYDEAPYDDEEAGEYIEEVDKSASAAASQAAPKGDPTISAVQRALVKQGFLESGAYTDGVLDGATLQAVRAFQDWYNESNGASLPRADGSIDDETLSILLG